MIILTRCEAQGCGERYPARVGVYNSQKGNPCSRDRSDRCGSIHQYHQVGGAGPDMVFTEIAAKQVIIR